MLPGGAGEAGQIGGHRQPQLVSERRWMIGRYGRQVCEAHHAQTLRPDTGSHEARERAIRGMTECLPGPARGGVAGAGRCCGVMGYRS